MILDLKFGIVEAYTLRTLLFGTYAQLTLRVLNLFVKFCDLC